MKNRIYILLLLATVFSGCGDSFLTIYPTSQEGLDEYYTTPQQIYKALVAAYDPLQWTDFYGGYNQLQFMSDLRSDDIFVGGDIGSYTFHHQMEMFAMKPVDAPVSLWECLYIGVNRSNAVIQNMPRVVGISDALRDRYLAEAYFLRAWYYHWLWKFWGNIPYYTTVLKAPYMAPQVASQDVYTYIMQDLDLALQKNESGKYKLPTSVSATEYGRITAYAAMMLRARVILYAADESRYDDILSDMQALKMSQLFILTTDFASIWLDEKEFITMPELNKTESIWEISHKSANGSWSWPQGGEGTIFPKFIGINGLENDPEYQAGWGFSPIRKEVYDLYEDGDTRRDGGIINIALRQQQYPEIRFTERADHTGYFNRKYTARKGYNDISYDVELNFNNNIRVFRYSEALLNLAEVALKKGNTNLAQSNLDLVRCRAFSLSLADYKASPRYQVVSEQVLLNERRLEFVGEGMRFWDLVRTGNTSLLTETNDVFSRIWNDNYRLLPIPSTEIDRTESEYKLSQNPGY